MSLEAPSYNVNVEFAKSGMGSNYGRIIYNSPSEYLPCQSYKHVRAFFLGYSVPFQNQEWKNVYLLILNIGPSVPDSLNLEQVSCHTCHSCPFSGRPAHI